MHQKIFKNAVLIFGWFFAILIALYFLLLLIANLPPVQRFVLDIAKKQGSTAIKGTLSIRSYSTNLLSFIDLYNIRIKSPSLQKESVSINKLHVNFSLLPLLQQKIVLPKIRATGGTLYALRDKSGKFKIPGIPIPSRKSAQKKKGGWQLEVGNVCASKIDLKYYDTQLHTTITLKKLDGCASLDSLQALLSSKHIKILSPRVNVEFDTLDINVRLQDSMIHVTRFLLNGPQLKLSINGQIPLSKKGIFNLDGRIVADVAPLTSKLIPPEHRITGTIYSQLKMKGNMTFPDIKANVVSSNLNYRDIPIDTFNLQSHFDQNDSLKIDSYLDNRYANANIHAEAVLKSIFKKPQLKKYRIDAQVKRINMGLLSDYFHIKKPELNGTATVNLLASGDNLHDLPADASLTLTVSEKSRLTIDTIWTFLSLKNSTWFMQALLGKGNHISGKGEIKLFNIFNGNFEANIGRPYLLSSLFLKYPVKGNVSLGASFYDALKSPHLMLKFNSDSLFWRGFKFTDLNAGVNYAKTWTIDSMYTGISADLQKVIIPEVENLQGNLNATIRASGNVFNPQVRADMSITDPGYQNWMANNISAAFFFRNNRLLVDSISILKDSLLMNTSGALDLLNPGYSFQMISEISEEKNAAVQLRSAGRYVHDTIQLTSVIDYARIGLFVPQIPVSPCVEGILRLNAVMDKHFCLKNGSLMLELNENAVVLPNPYHYIGAFTFGQRGLNGNIRIIGKKDSLSVLLASLQARSQNGCIRKGISFEDGSAVQLVARDFEFGELMETFFPGMFIRGMIHGNANAVMNSGSWLLGGNLHIIADTLSLVHQMMNLSGLKADAFLGGSLDKPVIDFSLLSKSINLDDNSSVNMRADGTLFQNRIEIDSLFSNFQNNGYLHLEGVVPLSWNNTKVTPEIRYDFQRVPLTLVNNMISAVTIKEGSTSGNGEIHTVSSELNANGNIKINGLKFYLNDCSGMAGPFDASIKLKNDQIILDSLKGIWGDGRISAIGNMRANIKAIQDLNAGIIVRNFSINCLDAIQIGIDNATTRIYKNEGTYYINTNVKMDESRIDKVFTISGVLNSFADGRKGASIPDAILQKINLEVGIDLNSNLLIDSNLGRFLLDGRMKISGPAARPEFNGVVNIEEGRVRYLDRDFDIEEGTITQLSANEINPMLNIDASSDVQDMTSNIQRDYTVNVTVRGTLKDPNIILSSNPQLDQQEIINLLTFGGTQGSPGFQTRGGQILSSYVTGLGSQYIEQITGLGNVSLSGNVFEQNGGLSLAVSQNLTSRISVSYETDVTDVGQYAVQVMYRLLRPIRLIGRTDSRGNSQIGLRFIFRR